MNWNEFRKKFKGTGINFSYYYKKYKNGDLKANQILSGSVKTKKVAKIRRRRSPTFKHRIQGSRYKKYPRSQDSYKCVENYDSSIRVCGVFDGHGKTGHTVSQKLANELPIIILSAVEKLKKFEVEEVKDLVKTIVTGYISQIYVKSRKTGERSIFYRGGSTAVISIQLLKFEKLVVVNIGDSKALWIEKGKIKQSANHDYHNSVEVKRLGKSLVKDRIAGILAVTRAIGDLKIEDTTVKKYGKRKNRYISYQPDIYISDLEGEYIVLMSDGIEEAITYGRDNKTMKDIYRMASVNGGHKKIIEWAKKNGTTDDSTVLVDYILSND